MNFNVIVILMYALVFGIMTAFVMNLLFKWKVIERYEMYKKRWMPGCNFCLAFWIGVVFVLTYILACDGPHSLVNAVCTACCIPVIAIFLLRTVIKM